MLLRRCLAGAREELLCVHLRMRGFSHRLAPILYFCVVTCFCVVVRRLKSESPEGAMAERAF